MKKFGILIALAMVIGFISCEKDEDLMYTNGDYKAEMAEFSHGWKEFMEVTITDDAVTKVNFNSVNADGEFKGDLTEYGMPDPPGLPSTWYPLLEAQYLAADIKDFQGVDGITGATSTSGNADGLFRLILDAAKEGDTSTQIKTD